VSAAAAERRSRDNRELVMKLLVIVVGMLGFAYAMVPMYRQICQAIGINATRVVAAPVNTQVDASREVRVELLASTAGGLPWKFEALDREVRLHPGELVTVRYRVTNTLGRAVTAHANMSTAPLAAGRWIAKQQCFCFTNQTLRAGETREMPVVFRVTNDVPRDVETIALSYTFFELPGAAS
jgi:cytochrome c oxidase assembly protein subunit 11